MITIRPSSARGQAEIGWLKAKYTFSFARYYDPNFMGFRSLRVINEDRVAPGRGFGEHPHDNMEIITYIISGHLRHRDSTGGTAVIGPGDIQHMSAGSGVTHSEINDSPTEPVHLLQIWIEPESQDITPSHEEAHAGTTTDRNRLKLIASKNPPAGALPVNADVRLYAATLDAGRAATLDLAPGRHAWIQVIRGRLTANSSPLSSGDGAAVSGETKLSFTAAEESEFLVFDLA